MTRSKARTTGAVYLAYFLTAVVAASLVGRIPVAYSDAAALVGNAVYVAVAVLLYHMFKPVSRTFAVLALVIGLTGCAVQSLSVFHLASPQSALPVFGFFNLVIGYLILRSTFLPGALGALMAVSGLAWLTVLSPELAHHGKTPIAIIGIVAEGSLMLWLLVMGVNVQHWNEQAGTAEQTRVS